VGLPECICIQECPKRKKGGRSVCGSDGRTYRTHCDLHRTACLTNTLLTIDRSNACSAYPDENEESDEEETKTNPKYSTTYKQTRISQQKTPKGRLIGF
jgi:hypothetical protein